jgi:catechol 2,3-dioxygenase-like lactoylglutathione lyase family enzyme
MSISLNHTIVWCRDQQRSATFLASLLGRPEPTRFEPFLIVELDNEVSLDYLVIEGDFAPQHYAFLTSEAEFDAIFGRIVEQAVPCWADPGLHEAGVINRHDGGRGVYFKDPDGHLLEIITRPYGSGG